jgi:hypothetical protein
LLPFSYHPGGDTLDQSGVFHHIAYTADDSKAGIQNALEALTAELASIHRAWPRTRIVVVGHSYGGLVAELWWAGVRAALPDHGGVVHVFTLDSPINGVPKAPLVGPVLGSSNAKFFLQRWLHQVNTAHLLIALDRDNSLTLVGSADDTTYSVSSVTGGGGNLYSQTIVRDCGGHLCAVPPVGVAVTDPRCDGATGDYFGTTHHDLVKACPQIVRLILAAVTGNLTSAALTHQPTTSTSTQSQTTSMPKLGVGTPLPLCVATPCGDGQSIFVDELTFLKDTDPLAPSQTVLYMKVKLKNTTSHTLQVNPAEENWFITDSTQQQVNNGTGAGAPPQCPDTTYDQVSLVPGDSHTFTLCFELPANNDRPKVLILNNVDIPLTRAGAR